MMISIDCQHHERCGLVKVCETNDTAILIPTILQFSGVIAQTWVLLFVYRISATPSSRRAKYHRPKDIHIYIYIYIYLLPLRISIYLLIFSFLFTPITFTFLLLTLHTLYTICTFIRVFRIKIMFQNKTKQTTQTVHISPCTSMRSLVLPSQPMTAPRDQQNSGFHFIHRRLFLMMISIDCQQRERERERERDFAFSNARF